ncbi:MAG: hypothetical protein J2P44_04385 [Candidatus Dormibacteraeota bacterium]|nr:hypothetical protein [Candidatus Dormibacteraeota bacterium]
MSTEADRRLVEFLSGCVRELRGLQEAGRLQDPASQAEVAFLEHELRVAEERVAGAVSGTSQEAAGVSDDPSTRRPESERERRPRQDT